MSFPLRNKKLIRGCKAHVSAGLGCGSDYQAKYEVLVMPFRGKVHQKFYEVGGGNWLGILDPDGVVIQFAHLDRYLIMPNAGLWIEPGTPIAVTGNTGQISTGPHLHVQIFKNGKRIDPETYNWDKFNKPEETVTQYQKDTEKVFAFYQLVLSRNPESKEVVDGYIATKNAYLNKYQGQGLSFTDAEGKAWNDIFNSSILNEEPRKNILKVYKDNGYI